MTNLKFKNSKIQKIIFLYFVALSQFTSYSQIRKESSPLFILQGTIKLQNKPIEGVSLELIKDGKQISKIITRKNGLYSFQMNKSICDKETEYELTIIKEGTVPGVLRVNTSISKEEFNYVPYVFNLEIKLTPSSLNPISLKESGNNLIPSVSNSNITHDFGKIKWNSERRVFDFDKEYAKMIEKNAKVLKLDSSQYAIEKKSQVEGIIKNKANEEIKQKVDSIATQQLANNNNNNNNNTNRLIDLKESVQLNSNKDIDEKKVAESVNKILTIESETGDKLSTITEPIPRSESQLVLELKKNRLKKKMDEQAKIKTIENKSTPGAIKKKKENPANKKEFIVGNGQQNMENKLQPTTNPEQATNLSSNEIDKNFFDGTTVFSINNEKRKLLNAKEKMEMKKAANLAQKYETNNILTSLLDRVEEYEAHPTPP